MNQYTFQISKHIKNNHIVKHYLSSVFSVLSKRLVNYPNHRDWYHNKVIPGLYRGDRDILCTISDNQIAGVAILKNNINEKKICSLYVLEQFRNRGIGELLFKESFNILETSLPLLSVSDLSCYQLKRLFRYFGFKDTFMLKNEYRIGSNEIVFNGMLVKETLSAVEESLNSSHRPNIDP